MADYQVSIQSINGDTALSTGGATYNCYFEKGGGYAHSGGSRIYQEDPLSTYGQTPIIAEILEKHPALVGLQPDGKAFPVTIELKSTTQTDFDGLREKFNIGDATEKDIVIVDGNGVSRKVSVVFLAIIPQDPPIYWQVICYARRPVWVAVTQTTHTENVATDSHSWNITHGGSHRLEPEVVITAVAQKSSGHGPLLATDCNIVSRSDGSMIDERGNPWPVNIVGTGFNAKALIQANKAHPQGYDVRVLSDGLEVNRYLSNWGAGFGDETTVVDYTLSDTSHRPATIFLLPGCSDQEVNSITEAGFYLKTDGVGTISGTLQLRIWNNASGGIPGTTQQGLVSNTVNVSVLTSSYAYVGFTWSAGVNLKARTLYWLELDTSGVTFGGKNIFIGVQNGGVSGGVYNGLYEGQAVAFTIMNASNQFSSLPALYRSAAFRVFPSGSAKIWVPMELEPQIHRTILSSLSATAVADGLSVFFQDAVGNIGLPDDMAWILNPTASHDIIICHSKDGENGYVIAKQGARGSSPTVHVKGEDCFGIQNRIQLLYQDYNPIANPTSWEPPEYAPAIDGVRSTNDTYYFVGPFMSIDAQNRPLSWRDVIDDSVDLSDRVSYDADAAVDGLFMIFQDQAASGAFIARNSISQQFPAPIKAAAGAITYTLTLESGLVIEHLLTNKQGVESVVQTDYASDSGTAKTITPAAPAYRYRLRASVHQVAAALATGTDILVVLSNSKAQTFTLENDSTLDAFCFKVKEVGTATDNLNIDLYAVNASDGTLDTSTSLMPTITITPADVTGAYSEVVKKLTDSLALAKGKYGLVFSTTDPTGYYLSGSVASSYAAGELRSGGGSSGGLLKCYAFHENTVDDNGGVYSLATTDSPAINGVHDYWQVINATPIRRLLRSFDLSGLPSGVTVTGVTIHDQGADYNNSTGLNAIQVNLHYSPANTAAGVAETVQGQLDLTSLPTAQNVYDGVNTAYDYGNQASGVALSTSFEVALGAAINLHLQNAREAKGFFTLGAWIPASASGDWIRSIFQNAPLKSIASSPTGLTQRGTGTYAADVNVNVTAHGYIVNDEVLISGAGLYNGKWTVVEVVDANNFVVNAPWTANSGAGTVQKNARDVYLLVSYQEDASAAYATVEAGSAWFRAYGSPSPTSLTISPSANDAIVSNVILALDNTITPYSLLSTAVNIVFINTTITVTHPDASTNVALLKAALPVGGTLTIEWSTRSVTSSDDNNTSSITPVVFNDIDEADPFHYDPGTNQITYADPGSLNINVQSNHYDEWV